MNEFVTIFWLTSEVRRKHGDELGAEVLDRKQHVHMVPAITLEDAQEIAQIAAVHLLNQKGKEIKVLGVTSV